MNFYPEHDRFKHACLSKIDFPEDVTERLQEWLREPSKFVVLYGKPGRGKSYFCWAVKNHFKKFNLHARYLKESEFFSKLREGMSKDWDPTLVIRDMCDEQLILFDDLGVNISVDKDKYEWRKQVIFEFIDTRYEATLPTIFTTNLEPKQLAEIFPERLISRIFARENLVIEIVGEDKRAEGF